MTMPTTEPAALPPTRHWQVLAAMLAASLVAGLMAAVWSWQRDMVDLDRALRDRYILNQHSLAAEVERLRVLPLVLEQDPRLQRALTPSATPTEIHAANLYLAQMRETLGAENAYLITTEGRRIASANWQERQGRATSDYGFRSYIHRALTQGTGLEYAIGIATGQPGLYLSARSGSAEHPRGVVVIKVALAQLETAWARAGEYVVVTDPESMVFLSSIPSWRFRPLRALSENARETLDHSRRYAGQDLARAAPLPLLQQGFRTPEAGPLRHLSGPVEGTDWQILVAMPTAPARITATMAFLTVGVAGCLLSALVFLGWQRRQIVQLRLRQTQELEARVAERTAELAQQVRERLHAEAELRRSHDSLVHAAKLTVLGRMSSAIVHEIGQSLSALEASLAAGELHLAQGAQTRAASSLERARGMVQRLREVVTRLRAFGRKQVQSQIGPVDLGQALHHAAELLDARRKELGATLTLPDGPWPSVQGDLGRLEQIFTNLLLNALEAQAATPEGARRILVRVTTRADIVEVEIEDHGSGVPDELLASLGEAFATSRPEGLGLGLYIVGQLLEHIGGTVRLSHPRAPTRFTVTLKPS